MLIPVQEVPLVLLNIWYTGECTTYTTCFTWIYWQFFLEINPVSPLQIVLYYPIVKAGNPLKVTKNKCAL